MKQKAKILILSPVVPYPPTDGGRLRTYKLCKALADKYDFTIIARVGPDDIRAIEVGGDDFLRKVTLIPVPIGEPKVQPSEGGKPGFFQKIANKFQEWSNPWQGMPHGISYSVDPNIKRAIEECLKNNGYGLIHIEHLYMAQYLREIQNIPAILTEIDVEYEKFRGFLLYKRDTPRGKWITRLLDNLIIRMKTSLQLRWVKQFESNLSRLFKLCITVSEKDKERLRAWNPDLEIVVVPNGVDVSYFTPFHSPDEVPTLTFTGHMGYFPNEDAVLYFYEQIFSHIKDAFPEVKFNVVGKSPSEKLLQLAESDANIKVTGFVDDVRPYMASNFLYVVPLRIGSGTRIKILEAMAMKMAVVSTSIGCEGLEVEDGKNIIVADEPDNFAAKVVELIKAPEKRRQIGEQARKLVEEKYDWKKIGEIQDKVYQQALQRQPPAFSSANDIALKLPLTKLVLDKVLASFLLVLTFPLTLLVAVAIKLDGVINPQNRGAIFYQEARVSQGKLFQLIKFRIFKNPAIEKIKEGEMPKKIENQPQNLTSVGKILKKFGLDEIPQFWNILRGEMSFVGPRPKPLAEYQEEIAKGIYRRKVIRAGLTGPVQIMKGTVRTFEDELKGDLEYIEKCRTLSSWKILLVDLLILRKSIPVLLKGTGE